MYFFERFYQVVLTIRILIILTNNFCTIAFQLLNYQKEFFFKFSKERQSILTYIKSTNFRSATVKAKEQQTRSTFANVHDFFFSSDWAIDNSQIRSVIKQFLKNIIDYHLNFQQFREFEKTVTIIFTSSISAFTENRSYTFRFSAHIKNDSSASSDIFIVWSHIENIFKKSINNSKS